MAHHPITIGKVKTFFRSSVLEVSMPRDNRKEAPKLNDQQEEMTVVIFRFKGGGETLRKGFDTVSQAIRQISPTMPVA